MLKNKEERTSFLRNEKNWEVEYLTPDIKMLTLKLTPKLYVRKIQVMGFNKYFKKSGWYTQFTKFFYPDDLYYSPNTSDTELLKYPQSIILGLDKVAHINSDDLTLTIASEECAELIQSITKVKRYRFHDKYEDNLHEEVADVLICIAELVCLGYLDIDKVKDYQKLKINREIEKAIQKEELRKEAKKYDNCE